MEKRNEEGTVNKLRGEYGGVQGLANLLGSDSKRGLPDDESELKERRKYYGDNQLPPKPSVSFCSLLLEALSDPTILVLITCALISISSGIYEAVVHDDKLQWIEGVSLIVTIIIVVFVASLTNYYKEKQFRKLIVVAQDTYVQVLRGGELTTLHVHEICVGDVIYVSQGNLLAADGVLIDSHGLQLDEAALTGETGLVPKDSTYHPFLLAGTKIMEGSGSMLVLAVGINSQTGIISRLSSKDDTESRWVVVNGTVSVERGSTTVRYTPRYANDLVIGQGSSIKIEGTSYKVSKTSLVLKSSFQLETPYGKLKFSKFFHNCFNL